MNAVAVNKLHVTPVEKYLMYAPFILRYARAALSGLKVEAHYPCRIFPLETHTIAI